MNIEQTVSAAIRQMDAIEDQKNFPVPYDFDASFAMLVFQAGAEAMRSASLKVLRDGGFNVLANTVNDIVI